MSHVSINMADMPVEVLNVVPVNPLISKCQIKVCYVGDEPNRNNSIITKDAARKLANSIPGCPIVGLYNEATGDFEEHNKIIEIGNGKIKFSDATRPYGFVSMDAPVWFQWFEDDGVPHEYLMTEGYIWTGQYPESQRIIDKGNNQSMELDDEILDAYWSKDNNGKPQFFIINEAIMSKLCILGEDVEPCFEGSTITKVEFAFEDNFKQKLFSLIEQMQDMLNKGGTPVFNTYAVEIGDALWSALYNYIRQQFPDPQDSYCSIYGIEGIYEENGQKFAILRDRSNPVKYFRLNFSLTEESFDVNDNLVEVTKTYVPAVTPQFALEAVEEYIAEFKKKNQKEEDKDENKEDEPEDEPSGEPEDKSSENNNDDEDDEEKKKKEKKNKYNLDEIPEYVALQNDYAAATARIAELEAANNQLTTANAELVEFKNSIETEKKQELINSFYMLSDEDKKDCQDNIATYSYDDIEAKLSIICVRNKVSFDLDGDKTKQEPTVFNLNDIDNDDDQGLPAWVQRVQEVAKDNNI